MSEEINIPLDPEIAAIGKVHGALRDLEAASQARVLDYVAKKLGVHLSIARQQESPERRENYDAPTDDKENTSQQEEAARSAKETDDDDSLEGISAVARKWMRRNGLDANDLSKLFSLGIEDIDLVAKSVPGDSKKDRMRNVLLLEGVAAYLGSGVARFGHDKLKEACLHYDAFDNTNFAKYYRDFNSEVSGGKDSDYTLTARGLSSATELIKQMIGAKS
jgi:hypothetical protein